MDSPEGWTPLKDGFPARFEAHDALIDADVTWRVIDGCYHPGNGSDSDGHPAPDGCGNGVAVHSLGNRCAKAPLADNAHSRDECLYAGHNTAMTPQRVDSALGSSGLYRGNFVHVSDLQTQARVGVQLNTPSQKQESPHRRIARSVVTIGLSLALSLCACRGGEVSPVSTTGTGTTGEKSAETGIFTGLIDRLTDAVGGGSAQESVLCLLTGPIIREDIRVGGILADQVNELLVKQGFRIGIQGSSNASFNLEALGGGSADLALVPAQFVYQNGPGTGGSPAALGIRSLSHLSMTAMTLLATDPSGIQEASELRGKRVGLVRPTQGDRKTLMDLLTSLQLTAVDLPLNAAPPPPPRESRGASSAIVYVTEGKQDQIEAALRAGTLDALFTSATHPSMLVRSALGRTPVHFVQIAIEMERIESINSAYEEVTISRELYPELKNTGDVHSVGTPMVLVASAGLSDDRAYQIVAAVSEKVTPIKATPYFPGFSLSEMVDGLRPGMIHPGAMRYYTEKRLVTSPPKRPEGESNTTTLAWAPPSAAREQLARGLSARSQVEAEVDPSEQTGEAGAMPWEQEEDPSLLPPDEGEGADAWIPDEPDADQASPDPDMQDSGTAEASGAVRLVAGEAVNDIRTLFARVSNDPSQVALIPTYAIPETLISTADPGEQLERRNIRSLFRLPGPVLHVVAAKDIELEDIRTGAPEKLGFSRDVPPTLIPCIRQELGVKGKPSTEPEEPLSDDELLSRLRSGKLTALVIAGAPPSTFVRQALSVKGGHLLSLPPPDQGACGTGVIEPENIPGSAYPVALKNLDLPAWTLPEALFVSSAAPVSALDGLVKQALDLLTGADEASSRSAKGVAWGLQGLHYPLHTAVEALKNKAEGLTTPSVIDERTLTIGTGNVEDESFRVALTLVRYLNRYCLTQSSCISENGKQKGKRIRGAVIPSVGFQEEVEAVLAGNMTFGLARADVLHAAVQGEGKWKGQPQTKLKTLATLYVPALTVLVTERQRIEQAQKAANTPQQASSKDMGGRIKALTDLEGRRTSIRRDLLRDPRDNAITLFRLEKFLNSQWRYALTTEEPFPMVGADMFSGGIVEALICLTSHPNIVIASLLQRDVHAHLIPVTGLDERLAELPYMSRTLISSAAYGGTAVKEQLIPTFGIPVVLFTLEDTPAEDVRPLLDAITSSIERFRKDNPTLSMISMDMLQAPSVAPFHPEAAAKYGLVVPTDDGGTQ